MSRAAKPHWPVSMAWTLVLTGLVAFWTGVIWGLFLQ